MKALALKPSLVDIYLEECLAPALWRFGIAPSDIRAALSDVGLRLNSLLAHWSNAPFKRTLLTLGLEEAVFWKPRCVPLDVRALVVLGVRDSVLEDLHAQSAVNTLILSDEAMHDITSEAVTFFGALNLSTYRAQPPAGDIFGMLPHRFPNAWECLSALAQSVGVETTYEARKMPANLIILPVKPHKMLAQHTLIASGMAADMDPGLEEILRNIKAGTLKVFKAPSFARITRNPVKMLHILEQVLSANAALVTNNYVLSEGYIARREPLIAPAHTMAEALKNVGNLAGLTPRHRELLEL